MNILGISALYHDSAVSLVVDGKIIAAAQEERFTRVKHDLSFPVHAMEYCLKEGNIGREEVDIVVFYDNPILTLDRYMKNILAAGQDSEVVISRGYESLFGEKLWIHKITDQILGGNKNRKFYVCEHHISHAASAFYPSPYNRAIIITLDGVGEWATTTISVGDKKDITIKEELHFPHSLGLLYSAFTYFCGFKVNSGDYKFMGLAPYGKPIYEEIIKDKLVDVKEDGSFALNMEYFDYQYGREMINEKFAELFEGPRREPESEITKREMDIAASAQKVVEEIILKLVRHAKNKFGGHIDNLVLAGGVALNCVANGKIKNSGIFKNIWIQPAAGDAGGSLGCALFAAYRFDPSADRICKDGVKDFQKGSYLGPEYSMEEIERYLQGGSYSYHVYTDGLYEKIAELLAEGKVIGLFHGRMEFGPRALGNRSIIADARSEIMQVKLNRKIKYRESFRPFAPSVLKEDVSEYFELEEESPYMLLVENVNEERREVVHVREDLDKYNDNMLEIVKQKRSDIPAVTHVDYSARIQTVAKEINPYYYRVISEFKKRTGCSVIVNTSFNVRGEPIVCTLKDAYECFMRTDMDVLVLEECILYKEEQPAFLEQVDWQKMYVLD
ncbi:MAG: carbamoyltransferase [Ruminococcus flavefaciens]|nr:carbamoyltransferase [Roseburia sp.]MCM1231453.1 carbamoyltransferase [Ruminococcus flavefaciens]